MQDFRRQEPFRLTSEFKPSGDQPAAIAQITDGLRRGVPAQVLLGVTGSGKTFTMANVIANLNRPALVLSHNKTLAAQLYREFKELFPQNAVEYFVSYYDYYMPEAYIASDTYIEKDSAINDELDKMRIAATKHLLERRDVIIVSSVSCIYGIGAPEEFHAMVCNIEEGQELKRDDFLRQLVSMLYTRTQHDFSRGSFRVRGDVVDIFPAYEDALAIRVTFFDDVIESIHHLEPLRGLKLRRLKFENIFPASHYVTARARLEKAMDAIAAEMEIRCEELKANNRIVEAARLRQRTIFDLEMMHEMGTCKGIENYSRHLAGRGPGDPPNTLLDYFPKDFILFVDESHVTLPQVRSMYRGDRARKETLVEYGFRLPSALDNRPLKGEEFEGRIGQTVYVSATPAEYELGKAGGVITELVVRPTGLLDPPIEVRPAVGQVDDLLGEIRRTVEAGWRVLATTLTKRFAEELVDYFADLGIRVRYLHSDIDAIERTRIIHGLRAGEFDVLVGINLLREGLDLPEVALIAILDADKEGFLRSATSLIQTCGRAARNLEGRVIMYADRVTDSMKACIGETERRREMQREHNEEHGISPKGITKKLGKILESSYYEQDPDEEMLLAREGQFEERYTQQRGTHHGKKKGKGAKHLKSGRPNSGAGSSVAAPGGTRGGLRRGDKRKGAAAAQIASGSDPRTMRAEELARDPKKLRDEIKRLRDDMKKAAAALDFEEAALLRDRLKELEKHVLIDLA